MIKSRITMYYNALNPDSGTEYLGYSEGPKDVYTQIYMQAKANYVRKFGLHDVGALLVYQRKEELLGNAGSVIKSLPKKKSGNIWSNVLWL